jgi:hypothetical protein
MRLWSLHPHYLDPQGLVALWREALLARAVLQGRTLGYRHHPQLQRFRDHATPRLAINAYLIAVHDEAETRGYRFDRGKIGPLRPLRRIAVSTGQVLHEWNHLLRKLERRNPTLAARWRTIGVPRCHPLFHRVEGPIEAWERAPTG